MTEIGKQVIAMFAAEDLTHWSEAHSVACVDAFRERDALKDAAKLALDVCIEMRRYGNQRSVAMAISAEAALKAVL